MNLLVNSLAWWETTDYNIMVDVWQLVWQKKEADKEILPLPFSCQYSRCSPFLSSRGSVVAPNLHPPSPPLPSQAGSGAKSPPGRIRCINSRPGIPAGRGFAVQGLCEVVWTEEGLWDMLALCCSSQPIWGVLGVVWLCLCGCISNGWSHRRFISAGRGTVCTLSWTLSAGVF